MEAGREETRLLRKATRFPRGTTCGHLLPEKEKRTRNQEAPILAVVLTLPRYLISWANSALVSTPVKWGEGFFFF